MEKEHVIHVNKKQYKVAEDKLNGKQILEVGGLNPNDYDLYLIHGQNNQKIEQDQAVDIQNGMHFNAIIRSAPYG
jgi:hypothetical protein